MPHRPESALRPTEGARFLFELESAADDGASARYRAAIYTPDQTFPFVAEVDLDGSHRIEPAAPDVDAPAELIAKLDMLTRLLARGARKKLTDGLPAWPHRVLRWKGPGRG